MDQGETSPPPVVFSAWGAARFAVSFLTRLPAARADDRFPDDAVARAAWAFPLVGAAVGLCSGLVFMAGTGLGLAAGPAAVLALAAELVLTGALHDDGIADTADGLGGGGTREAKLAILRDSRIGTYGAAALALTLLARVAAVAAIGEERGAWAVLAALVAANALARAAIVGGLCWLRPARADGLGARAGTVPGRVAALAFALALACAAGLSPGRILLLAVVGVGVMAGVLALARRQIGGYTGDILGAAAGLVLAAGLLALSART